MVTNKNKKYNVKNLKPFNTMSKEKARAIQSKGGRTVTPRKRLQNRLNGMSNMKLDDRQKYLLAMFRDKDLVGVITELIQETILEHKDPARRDKAVEQLQRLLPQKVLNVNINKEADDVDEEVFDIDGHLSKILK